MRGLGGLLGLLGLAVALVALPVLLGLGVGLRGEVAVDVGGVVETGTELLDEVPEGLGLVEQVVEDLLGTHQGPPRVADEAVVVGLGQLHVADVEPVGPGLGHDASGRLLDAPAAEVRQIPRGGVLGLAGELAGLLGHGWALRC